MLALPVPGSPPPMVPRGGRPGYGLASRPRRGTGLACTARATCTRRELNPPSIEPLVPATPHPEEFAGVEPTDQPSSTRALPARRLARFPARSVASVELSGACCACPRQESNLRARFRRPQLYPLSYGGIRTIGRVTPAAFERPGAVTCRRRAGWSAAAHLFPGRSCWLGVGVVGAGLSLCPGVGLLQRFRYRPWSRQLVRAGSTCFTTPRGPEGTRTPDLRPAEAARYQAALQAHRVWTPRVLSACRARNQLALAVPGHRSL